MKPFQANLLAAFVLIIMSLWGYFSSDTPSMTALIPAIFGVVFLGLHGGMRKESKVAAHIVVVLTLVVLISLFKPFSGAMDRGDNIALLRVGLMILVSLLAMIVYIRSFINARRARS